MKKINFKIQIAAGVILIICGTLALLSNYIKDKRDVVFSEMNLALSSFDKTSVTEEAEGNDEEEVKKEEKDDTYVYEDYLGVMDIPKINFHRGFYKKDSNLNNVNFNLYVHPISNYPDTNKGNLIIAGHSGNYNNSYFRDLYLLQIGDIINIDYNNSKYTYKIVNIYNEEKTGMIRIIRNKEKTVLTLVTCTKDDESHQTVYIAELVSVG